MTQGWARFMDRRFKERLVGATILVVLVVLIVPELLSGPKPVAKGGHVAPAGLAEPTRNVTVDLATSRATPEQTAEEPDAPAAAPVMTPNVQVETAAAAPAVPAAVPPAAAPTITTLQAQQPGANVAAHGAATGEPMHHNWAVQLGSFASKVNAEKLAQGLKAEGFAAFLSPIGSGAGLRYRVRVGPMADRAGADRIFARLRKEGHAVSIIAP